MSSGCRSGFDLATAGYYHGGVRQFIYGVIIGAGFWYAYERLDPPAILAYLNSATEYAVRSTSGYGGHDAKR